MCWIDRLESARPRWHRSRKEGCNYWSVSSPLSLFTCPSSFPVSDTSCPSGGLGHFAILWAAALGAEVYVISHSPRKEADALKLGAKKFIATQTKDWHKDWAFAFDFILNTADMTHTFNIQDYMSTLNVNGEFHHVGLPDEPLPTIMAQDFTINGCKMGASHIGNRQEMLAMLKLASEKNIKPMIETLEISEKACAEAVERVSKNDVKYRFSLTGYDKVFGK